MNCPCCGSKNVKLVDRTFSRKTLSYYLKCEMCNKSWEQKA